ncbi:receptor-like protein 51 [Triticum dicoccoides]|uniref:receptor-like protein 51 n=1 Tax=Triticum dicoccoides TaxID=85692 RepID=UPI00188F6164|nr:receptor-like protein 51 [Triticum dicoccoides]
MEAFDKMLPSPSVSAQPRQRHRHGYPRQPRAATAAASAALSAEAGDERCALMPKATDPCCPNNAHARIRPSARVHPSIQRAASSRGGGPPATRAGQSLVNRARAPLAPPLKPFPCSNARRALPLPLRVRGVAATASFALGLAGRAQLDPQQLLALRALGLGARRAGDPCDAGGAVAASCDAGAPFRRVTSLALTNCSDTTSVSAAALEALAPSLRALAFSDCPAAPPRLLPPEQLAAGLLSFSCTASLGRLSAVWLSRLANLTELTVANTPLATGSPSELAVVISHMDHLNRLTISNANLSGFLPHHWHCPNLTHLDLSGNRISGAIPDTITHLGGITHLNLSSNALKGQIPAHIGDLIWLTTVDLSNNSLSGGIPETVSTLPELEVLNLGSNRLNGSIPPFLSEMRGLKELNLENNDFDGVVPFSARFLSRLQVFRAAGNGKLCYNRSELSAEVAVGVAPCDKYGFPVTAPPATAQSEKSTAGYDDGGSDGDADGGDDARGGPSAVVLGLAIGLSCLAFVIILVVCLCKVCR